MSTTDMDTDTECTYPQEMSRLSAIASKSCGLKWCFAVINHATQRDYLITKLNELDDVKSQIVKIEDNTNYRDVRQLFADSKSAERLHVVLAEGCILTGGWWTDINGWRESLAEAFPGPVIFWLPDYATNLAARNAVDFWNWRSGLVDFTLEPEEVANIKKGCASLCT